MTYLIIFALVAMGGGVVVYAVRGTRGANPLAVSARLGRYGLTGASGKGAASAVPIGPPQISVKDAANKLVDRGGLGVPLTNRLRRADLKMTPAEFLVAWAAIFALSIPLGFILFSFGGIIAFAIVVAIGAGGPWFYLRRRINKRRRAFIGQLADMAQMMGNSMRAGFSIIQSMELVGKEASKPASEEFERVVTEVKLGLQVDVALDHLLERMPSEDMELMVVAINVQRQIGGNLSEILAVISNTIRLRVRFERDLKALTAQARYSSYIITALPVAVAVVINFMDREYESWLYTATLGHVMLGVAVCMLATGFFFLSKIANIEV
jgi:tight adherence protein B